MDRKVQANHANQANQANQAGQIIFSVEPAFSILQSGIPGEAGATDFIDSIATNQVRAFYRVYVE
jgi:hypothetical protein